MGSGGAADRLVREVLVPHLVLGWLLVHHEDFAPRAAGRLAAAYHLTTPFYWVVPTAPPWWAFEHKELMDGEVERVRRHVLNASEASPGRHGKTRRRRGIRGRRCPPITWLRPRSPRWASRRSGPLYGALGWSYVALASFAVVHLGEHYVIDVIAGLAVAEAVRRAEPAVNPLVHRFAHAVDRLAP